MHQFCICVQDTQTDPVESLLQKAGAECISIEAASSEELFDLTQIEEQTLLLWSICSIKAYFSHNPGKDTLCQLLTKHQIQYQESSITYAAVQDKIDWTAQWKNSWKPLEIGRLHVHAGHEAPQLDKTNMVLEPGLGFGSGQHPTTHLCLEWLESIQLENKTCIDYGCGSGILALACALLGAQHTTATDIDPQALLATTQNALKNNIHIEVVEPDTMQQEYADVVVANILLGSLCDLSARLSALVVSGGLLALSGITNAQANKLLEYYEHLFQLEQSLHKDGWALLVLKKRS